MPKEVLAGAVLDLQQRSETLAQTMSDLGDTALRVKDERDAAVKLLRSVLQISELGAEGPTKTNIRAFLARLGKPQTITRFDRQRQLEREIVAFNPDTVEAQELAQSLMRALQDRYGDAAVDVLEQLNEVREALDELGASTATGNSAEDEAHDLDRARPA